MLVDLDDEFLRIEWQDVCRLLIVGDVGVGDDEVKGSLDVHDRVHAVRLRDVSLHVGDTEQVVHRDGVVAAELGQRPEAGLFEAEFQVAQVGVGDPGVGFYLSECLGSAKLLEQFANGRALSGYGVDLVCWRFGLGGDAVFGNSFFRDHFPTILALNCYSFCYNVRSGACTD